MGSRRFICAIVVAALSLTHAAQAQWTDAKLAAGQIGFNVAASFIGKLVVGGKSPKEALSEALREGAFAGAVAHTGYSIAGANPDLGLVGKALAQKAALTTRRSIRGEPVFDDTLYKHWEISHAFLHFKWHGAPKLELDAVNLAFAVYHFGSSEPYDFDLRRTLTSGSLVFQHQDPSPFLRGYYTPGVIWFDADDPDIDNVMSHEIVHSFQIERGSSISVLRFKSLRFNWLAFASGVPALLSGWPEHDTRWHEVEADRYADGH